MGKTRDFATKMREFLHKAPRFPDLLARRKAAWELFRRQVGRFILGGDSMRTKEGKEGSLPLQKIPFARARGRCKGDLFEMCCPMGNGD
jgi:hypothetical protein